MDHIKLICDIGEINEIFIDSKSIEAFLYKIVNLVARYMNADVCSVYLYEEENRELVLRATKGLNKESVNNVRLKLGEGLTGLALKEMRPVYERVGKDNPKFKPVPGISEEKYDAFLCVPIARGIQKIGVIVVQRKKAYQFKEKDIATLRAVASQLASMIENARLLISMQTVSSGSDKKHSRLPKLIKGKVASEGFAHGPAKIIIRGKLLEIYDKKKIRNNHLTLNDFLQAVSKTEYQLENLQKQIEEKLSDVASLIFTAHLLLLKDKEFVGSMVKRIEDGESPTDALMGVARHYIDLLSHNTNSYIQEKILDIEDLCMRIMNNLVDEEFDVNQCEGRVIIARELFPSDILKLSSEKAAGIVLVTGGVTSHLSILARSLCIPTIIIDNPKLLSIQESTKIMVDAEIGTLFINPSDTVIDQFRLRDLARKKIALTGGSTLSETVTKDGQKIRLLASINLLSDLKLAHEVNCEGIGLYRTEFPFLIRSDFPSEEEQFVIYQKLVDGSRHKEITFRTLDIGGDKVLSYFDTPVEQNPFLGMRSIRFSLSYKELFYQQLRAMLRASVDASIRIMFPLISTLEELLEAKMAVEECMSQLKAKKIPHNSKPLLGIMVEIPSAVSIIDELADHVDFFSIGTNDLVQYMLAVDRTNEKVASLYIQHHPAVLRAIKVVADAAIKKGKGVAICGDMAHHERYLPFFIGAGIRELTIESSFIPNIQKAIARIDSKEAEKTAKAVLSSANVTEIARLLK